jgi:hypothetical protein
MLGAFVVSELDKAQHREQWWQPQSVLANYCMCEVRSRVYEMVADGSFPKPVQLSARAVA